MEIEITQGTKRLLELVIGLIEEVELDDYDGAIQWIYWNPKKLHQIKEDL